MRPLDFSSVGVIMRPHGDEEYRYGICSSLPRDNGRPGVYMQSLGVEEWGMPSDPPRLSDMSRVF